MSTDEPGLQATDDTSRAAAESPVAPAPVAPAPVDGVEDDEAFEEAQVEEAQVEEAQVDAALAPRARSVRPPPPSARRGAAELESARAPRRSASAPADPPPPPSARTSDLPSLLSVTATSLPSARAPAPPPPRTLRSSSPPPSLRLPLPAPSARIGVLLEGREAPLPLPPAKARPPTLDIDVDTAQPEAVTDVAAAPAAPRASLEPKTDEAPPSYADLARTASSPDLSSEPGVAAALAAPAPVALAAPAPVAATTTVTASGGESPKLAQGKPKPVLSLETDDIDAAWASVMSRAPSLPPPAELPAAARPVLPPLPALGQPALGQADASAPEAQASVAPTLSRFDEGPTDSDLTERRSVTDLVKIDGALSDGELTRPLDGEGLSKIEQGMSDVDLTRPLLGGAAAFVEAGGVGAVPYASDSELTRPLPPGLALPPVSATQAPAPAPPPRPSTLRLAAPPAGTLRPTPVVGALPPPPAPPAPRSRQGDVPVIVAVPPRRGAEMEHAPSIQIAGSDSSEFTPTTQLDRAVSSTPPARVGSRQPTLPRIPPPARVPQEFAPRSGSPSMAPVTGSVPPGGFGPLLGYGRTRRQGRWLIGLAALTIGVAALAVGLRPRAGSVVVTVSGPTGGPVANVSVRVDGVERCRTAPCQVKDLEPGTHFISASSGSGPGVERALVLDSGERAAHHVTLSTVAEVRESGLSVAALGEGLRVFVDGKDLGAPPVALEKIEPGPHLVRVVGREPYYEPYEERVRIEPGEVRSLGPVRLRVRVGRLELGAGDGADGASVMVGSKRVASLPAVLELPPDVTHEIVARRPGYEDFTHQVVFDGVAERKVEVQLDPLSGAAPAAPARRIASNTQPSSRARGASVTAGSGFLDLSSNERAAVVLDGRPMGATPLRAVKVSPGSHTVVFIHPKLGRKVRSVSVGAGARAAAFAKF